ncbi:hypothetical protein [Flavobacterium terrigena]|uniref:Lipoprotein n=1 Tax=Flavobacterium terrigena TaxID=402734 RepID=A0A1H6VK31_9FLAO|nr:hypothetical protein [Flavobacterium terrigena]SEJ01120.1 hypothetical protein SAMN05660918_2144 [Flavobacterium terrigena]
MKNVIYVMVILFSLAACKSVRENPNEITITSKKEVAVNDYTIVIDKIISDSRCPEGVTCVWAGELVVKLSVWQNEVLKETTQIAFSPSTRDENLAWFVKYIPQNKKLKSYKVSPIKTENRIELKDYKIQLILE